LGRGSAIRGAGGGSAPLALLGRLLLDGGLLAPPGLRLGLGRGLRLLVPSGLRLGGGLRVWRRLSPPGLRRGCRIPARLLRLLGLRRLRLLAPALLRDRLRRRRLAP
jgi:hypothetical protein